MTIQITETYRHLRPGDRFSGSIGMDDLNFYVHGVNDEYPVGYHSNYLVVPRYAAKEVRP